MQIVFDETLYGIAKSGSVRIGAVHRSNGETVFKQSMGSQCDPQAGAAGPGAHAIHAQQVCSKRNGAEALTGPPLRA